MKIHIGILKMNIAFNIILQILTVIYTKYNPGMIMGTMVLPTRPSDPTMSSKGWYEGAGKEYEFKGEAGGRFEMEEEFGAKGWEYGEAEVDNQLEIQIDNVM